MSIVWSDHFPYHTTKHLHFGTFVLNYVIFMFQSGGLGNSVFSLVTLNNVAEASTSEHKRDTI